MYEILPIEKYYEKMAALLNVEKEKWFRLLSVDWVFGKILKSNYDVKWIKDWDRFEWGKLTPEEDWDENNFYELVFKGLPNQKVMLLTDEGIKTKKCFEFDLDSFPEFVEWYEDEYELCFMEPHDYIIILENDMIKAIHHGGITLEQHTLLLNKEMI